MRPADRRPWFELEPQPRMPRWLGQVIQAGLSLVALTLCGLAIALVLGWRPW